MTRTYVVTGAASGIGKTTAAKLTAQGHNVIGVDLRDVEVVGDLSTPAGRVAAAAEATRLANGRIDGVIACAGLAIPKPITVAVNYFGMTEFLEALLPALGKSDAPRVALISSMASIQPVAEPLVDVLLTDNEPAAIALAEQLVADPRTANSLYSSSKRAISRWVRREAPTAAWAGAGIPLNAVGPGTVITPMTADLLSTPEGAARVDAYVPMPLNGHQAADTVADLLIWLTSVENSHLCGQMIYCDGGADVVLRGDDVWSWNEAAIVDTFSKITF